MLEDINAIEGMQREEIHRLQWWKFSTNYGSTNPSISKWVSNSLME